MNLRFVWFSLVFASDMFSKNPGNFGNALGILLRGVIRWHDAF
jgi:hypothetical protein